MALKVFVDTARVMNESGICVCWYCDERRLYSQLSPVTSLTFSPSERDRQRVRRQTLSGTETATNEPLEIYIPTANGHFRRNED